MVGWRTRKDAVRIVCWVSENCVFSVLLLSFWQLFLSSNNSQYFIFLFSNVGSIGQATLALLNNSFSRIGFYLMDTMFVFYLFVQKTCTKKQSIMIWITSVFSDFLCFQATKIRMSVVKFVTSNRFCFTIPVNKYFRNIGHLSIWKFNKVIWWQLESKSTKLKRARYLPGRNIS